MLSFSIVIVQDLHILVSRSSIMSDKDKKKATPHKKCGRKLASGEKCAQNELRSQLS